MLCVLQQHDSWPRPKQCGHRASDTHMGRGTGSQVTEVAHQEGPPGGSTWVRNSCLNVPVWLSPACRRTSSPAGMSRLMSLPGEEGDLRVLKVESSTEFAADVGDTSQNVPAKGSGSGEMLETLKMPLPPPPAMPSISESRLSRAAEDTCCF